MSVFKDFFFVIFHAKLEMSDLFGTNWYKRWKQDTEKASTCFTNMFTSSFYLRRSQKHKSQDSQVKQLFALLGPASIKAGRKHVDEIDICFTNICVKISYKI